MRKGLCCFTLVAVLLYACTGSRELVNPLLPSGADPWAVYHKGKYYYTHTLGNRLELRQTRNMQQLSKAKKKTVFQPPPNTDYSKGLWAPELHPIDGNWYLYFAADNGRNEAHRMYVLQNSHRNPMKGSWKLMGKISDSTNRWAIDGSTFEHNGQRYFIWSGWEGAQNGQQDIYIAKMKNPWTIDGPRVRISSPQFSWERHGTLNDPSNPPHVAVNEGPQFLRRDNKVMIVYSASGCWTDQYCLGLLYANAGSDLLDPASWTKHPEPVFSTNATNEVYAPGHNSFFHSPDGQEDWILYHANDAPGQGCGRHRSPRAQRFYWNEEGLPVFGQPLKKGTAMPPPSR